MPEFDQRIRLQKRSDCYIGYFHNDYNENLTDQQKEDRRDRMLQSRQLAYKGKFSDSAKKRMARAIDILIQTTKITYGLNEVTGKRQRHFLSYITLTIPATGDLTAEQGYHGLLKHFLQWLRRTKKVNTYIWKAEFQQRGQLHYHITTPAWIHYQEIKDKWNNLLQKVGMLSEYYAKQGHNNANSTDIHEVRNITGLCGYLKKEYYKSIQNKDTTGKIWDCSENLKAHKYYTVDFEPELFVRAGELRERGLTTEIECEQCFIIKERSARADERFLTLKQMKGYDEWKASVKNYNSKEDEKLSIQSKRFVLCDTQASGDSNRVDIVEVW